MIQADSLLDLPDDVAAVLDSVVAKQGLKKPRFLVEPGSGNRDGYSSDVFRVIISDEAAPDKAALHIIAKRSRSHLGALMSQMFATEALMYELVLPALEDVAGLREPLPWPRCYNTAVTTGPPFVVALGDLRPDNFAMADRTKLMDAAHCDAVVAQLAALHGAGLALKHLRPDDFRERQRHLMKNPWGDPDMKTNCRALHVASLNAGDIIKDKFPVGSDVNKAVVKLFREFLDHNLAFAGPVDAPGYTIIHNDCHINNLMFQYDKGGAVTGCRLIDFQTAFYGNPALDLCTLLLVCTEKDVRDAHWDRLMRDYHAKLQQTLRAAGCKDPDAIMSWELLQSLLALAAPYALAMMPLYYHGLYGSDEVIKAFKDMMEAVFKTSDSSSSSDQDISFQPTPRYKSCLEGLVQDMVDKGWLPSVADIDLLLSEYAQRSS